MLRLGPFYDLAPEIRCRCGLWGMCRPIKYISIAALATWAYDGIRDVQSEAKREAKDITWQL